MSEKDFNHIMDDMRKEIEALKQQLHTERESLKKEADELMMKKIEHYEKEIALVKEQCQIDLLTKDKRISELVNINVEHQILNGELREDNKKLAKHVDDLLSRLDKLRHLGVI